MPNDEKGNAPVLMFTPKRRYGVMREAVPEETKHPISKVVGRVVIAVPLILKLLELQKVVLPENEVSKIKALLTELRSLDMLMVSRLEATSENMAGLTKGRDVINGIKDTLVNLASKLPTKDNKQPQEPNPDEIVVDIEPKVLIQDAIEIDIGWPLGQFGKKIKELESENPALADQEPHLTPKLH
jgi:hypothetical protein